MTDSTELQLQYRAIPSVQELMQDGAITASNLSSTYLKRIITSEIDTLRDQIAAGKLTTPSQQIAGKLRDAITKRIKQLQVPSLRKVVNATGIILHTNLGRAPLAEEAATAVSDVLTGYTNLEIDMSSGARGNRMSHVEEMICLLTNSEAALVVNNCAAAVLLALNTLCKRKEVIVSRGELVEIGGSFRIPEVMKSSGAKMVEVGTTNKTHLRDFKNAISSRTGAIMRVHTSNYRIMGFTASAELHETVQLAHDNSLPLIYDMGSGTLEDVAKWGLASEPVASEVIESGVDVITFSGDKMLGGPQAGIICGRKTYLDKLKKNHLTRALRCDKMVLAALEATLRLHLTREEIDQTLPLNSMLATTMDALQARAAKIKSSVTNSSLSIDVVEASGQIGSGALPLEALPSIAIKCTSTQLKTLEMSRRLRLSSPPVVGYVKDDALILNMRTVQDDDIDHLVAILNIL